MRLRILLVSSLLLVGALVGCSTQRIESPSAGQAQSKEFYIGLHTTDWEVRVKIDPLLPGERSASLKLIAHEGDIPAGTLLALELGPPESSSGVQRFEATPLGSGDYKIDALPITAGKWHLRVFVSVPGQESQSSGYTVDVPAK